MGLASGKSSRKRGGAVRIKLVSSRMPAALSQWLMMIGNLVVRYLGGDTNLFSSIGLWLRPSTPQCILKVGLTEAPYGREESAYNI